MAIFTKLVGGTRAYLQPTKPVIHNSGARIPISVVAGSGKGAAMTPHLPTAASIHAGNSRRPILNPRAKIIR